MTTAVLICDDSSFARKQIARALPADWQIDVSFAEHGADALQILEAGGIELMFLDLNMPVMDGYEVLAAIRDRDLSVMVVVVSGDIQPEAHERVMGLGALGFIKKPVDRRELIQLLDRYGIRTSAEGAARGAEVEVKVELLDVYREVANVAMGRAGDRLARLLGLFVSLPVPRVAIIEASDLRMTLQHVAGSDGGSAVCQGFIGAGIAGEALLTFDDASIAALGELLHYEGKIDDSARLELIMDVASLLTGALLNGIAEQLDVEFSQGHPQVLGRHLFVDDILERNAARWSQLLAIEFGYRIEACNFSCDLVLLFTEDSMKPLGERAAYLESSA